MILSALETLFACFLIGVGLMLIAVSTCGAIFIIEEFRDGIRKGRNTHG